MHERRLLSIRHLSGLRSIIDTHLNTLREAEMAGDRVVDGEFLHYRGLNDYPTIMVHKSVVDQKWRKEIRDEYLRGKLQALDQGLAASDVVDDGVEEISTNIVDDDGDYLEEF
ncbi:hypothetical protein Y032_0042g621 [Ancylostoma ceylanicum]|uniref:Uncharacterized protein n=1 Tax=Ancylostoma ceylanicum TaxID=53326 RepID=A0A016UGB6_9BILA|nr:hypothetical protein Y032_0042g621 [Ancylostoma ceylanicum]